MFRKMRRFNQQLSNENCINILKKATSGTLAIQADDDYPYAVPLSFAYDNGKIYFHCAKEGHKIDLLRNNEKVSFCVIEKDDIIPEKFTTAFTSVIAFGKIKFIEETGKKIYALKKLAEKYSPNIDSKPEISGSLERTCILELNIEHMTGKQAKELVK